MIETIEDQPAVHTVSILPEHRFQLSDKFVEGYRRRKPQWGPLGEVTFRRTYAREVEFNGKKRPEEWWETVRRVVNGAYTYQKWHCRETGLPWSDRKAQTSAQEMYELIFSFKFLPPGRGLWMCGTEYVERVGSAALNNCLKGDVEILTADGIKQIGECAGTVQTLLTDGGKWIDAQVRSFGVQKLTKVTLKRMGVKKTLYATAGHRWFAADRRSAWRGRGYSEFITSDLRPGQHKLQYVFGQSVKNTYPSPFGIAHGVAFGDGATVPGHRNANRLMLCGDKDKELLPYFSACRTKHCEEACEGGGIQVMDLPNNFKQFPSLRENKSYLYGWLAGYFAADGSVSEDGQACLTSSVKENIEFAKVVSQLIGIGAYDIREQTVISNLTGLPHTTYKTSFMRDTLDEKFFLLGHHKERFIEAGEPNRKCYWTVEAVEPTDLEEEVFCATVPGYGKFALADNILTGNCAFTTTANIHQDFADPFCFLMDFSMLGVGVGGNTAGAGKVVIKQPTTTTEPHVVADTREGWTDLVKRVLNSYVGKATYPSIVDYSQVRGAGEPIKGFGGISAGPEPLKRLVAHIDSTLAPLAGKPITSTAIVDLFNQIGVCVVSGNVRRSAEIMLGQPDDTEFADLKNPAKNQQQMNEFRWASNNSIYATVGMDYAKHAASTAANGEPGYFWLETTRAYGRMSEPATWADANVAGTNPCSEQSLEDHELCCLVETFPSLHDDYESYERTLKFAYLYAKSITLVPTHNPTVNARVMRNRRIGCSQSGIIDSFAKHGKREHLKWCDRGYQYLRKLDRTYSDWLCIPLSRKITSVKPSGTVSLLPGVSPGIHYPHSEFYYRTMRLRKGSPLVDAMVSAGYRIEDCVGDNNSVVIYFPVHEKHFDRSKTDVSMWEQLENAAAMQSAWADNQVSITVTFKPEEAGDIRRALEAYETRLKSVSFLPLREHGYVQAPYIEISGDEYAEAVKHLKQPNFRQTEHEVTDAYCDGDTCVIPG